MDYHVPCLNIMYQFQYFTINVVNDVRVGYRLINYKLKRLSACLFQNIRSRLFFSNTGYWLHISVEIHSKSWKSPINGRGAHCLYQGRLSLIFPWLLFHHCGLSDIRPTKGFCKFWISTSMDALLLYLIYYRVQYDDSIFSGASTYFYSHHEHMSSPSYFLAQSRLMSLCKHFCFIWYIKRHKPSTIFHF